MDLAEIDKAGYFIQDVNLHRNIDTAKYVKQCESGGLYKPRWDFEGNKWVEGLDSIELENKLADEMWKRKIAKAEILAKRVMNEKKDGAVWRDKLIDLKRGYKKQIKGLE